MAIEIERKFLVEYRNLPVLPVPSLFEQGYVSVDPTVRVRLITDTKGTRKGLLTLKTRGLRERNEYEFGIPPAEAAEVLATCSRRLWKFRFEIPHGGRTWELDFFPTINFWLAEIELNSLADKVVLPDWVTDEVTDDARYQNTSISERFTSLTATSDLK